MQIHIISARHVLLWHRVYPPGEMEHIDEKNYQKVSGKVEVLSALLEGACNGYVTLAQKADLSFSSRLNTEYTYRSGPKQQIVLNNKVRYRTTKNLKHYFVSRCVCKY